VILIQSFATITNRVSAKSSFFDLSLDFVKNLLSEGVLCVYDDSESLPKLPLNSCFASNMISKFLQYHFFWINAICITFGTFVDLGSLSLPWTV
jgi:hypothetical protein